MQPVDNIVYEIHRFLTSADLSGIGSIAGILSIPLSILLARTSNSQQTKIKKDVKITPYGVIPSSKKFLNYAACGIVNTFSHSNKASSCYKKNLPITQLRDWNRHSKLSKPQMFSHIKKIFESTVKADFQFTVHICKIRFLPSLT